MAGILTSEANEAEQRTVTIRERARIVHA